MADRTHEAHRSRAVLARATAARRPRARRRGIDERSRIRRAEHLLSDIHAELRKADAKATGLLALAGACGIGLAQFAVTGDGVRMVVWWAAFLLWAVAVALLAAALAPRTGSSGDPRQLAFFGHLRGLGADRIDATLRRHPERLPGLISELTWTSRAVSRKYRLISIALICLVVALIATIGTAA